MFKMVIKAARSIGSKFSGIRVQPFDGEDAAAEAGDLGVTRSFYPGSLNRVLPVLGDEEAVEEDEALVAHDLGVTSAEEQKEIVSLDGDQEQTRAAVKDSPMTSSMNSGSLTVPSVNHGEMSSAQQADSSQPEEGYRGRLQTSEDVFAEFGVAEQDSHGLGVVPRAAFRVYTQSDAGLHPVGNHSAEQEANELGEQFMVPRTAFMAYTQRDVGFGDHGAFGVPRIDRENAEPWSSDDDEEDQEMWLVRVTRVDTDSDSTVPEVSDSSDSSIGSAADSIHTEGLDEMLLVGADVSFD